MGGYGYNQTQSSSGLPSSGGGNDHSTSGGDPKRIEKLGSGVSTIGGQMSSNAAAQSGYEATSISVGGSVGGSAAGSAAASGAAGAGTGVVAGGATTSTMGSEGLAALLFYGGETVSQIKSNAHHQVNVVGSTGLKTGEDKTFYKNVHIPRKKV